MSPAQPSPSSGDPGEPGPVVSDLARLRTLSRIAEQVGEGVAVTDNDGWFQYVNPAFAAQHATTVEALAGAYLSDFYRPEDFAAQVQPVIAAALADGIGRGAVTRLRKDGSEFPARITLSLLRDDEGLLIGRVLCVQDVSAQHQLEERLREAALHDPLTGLANRRLLRDRVEHALALRARGQTGVAAVFADLDGFKWINDRHGHRVGDEVLREVARRLATCIRGSDTLARHGGDEFVILLEGLTDTEQALQICRRMHAALAAPVRTEAGTVSVSVSLGIQVAASGDDYDALLQAADRAMYRAKRQGPGGVAIAAQGTSPPG